MAAVFEPSPYNVAFVHPLLRRFVATGTTSSSSSIAHRQRSNAMMLIPTSFGCGVRNDRCDGDMRRRALAAQRDALPSACVRALCASPCSHAHIASSYVHSSVLCVFVARITIGQQRDAFLPYVENDYTEQLTLAFDTPAALRARPIQACPPLVPSDRSLMTRCVIHSDERRRVVHGAR